MYQEFLVYVLAAVVVIFSIAQGGFVLSMAAIVGTFYLVDVTRRKNPSVGKRTLVATVATVAIFGVGMLTSLV